MKSLRPYSLNRDGGLLLPLYILSVAISLLLGLFWPLRMFGNYKINHVTNMFLLLRSKVVWRLPPSKASSFKLLATSVHLSKIRIEWNKFYKDYPNATKQQFLGKAKEIDDLFGSQFYPPIR